MVNSLKKIYTVLISCFLLLFMSGCENSLSTSTVREKKVKEFQVINVIPYLATETNNFGGIINQEIKYEITYIDDNNNIGTISDFENMPYGLEKIKISDKTYLAFEQIGLDVYKILYITSDDYEELGKKEVLK